MKTYRYQIMGFTFATSPDDDQATYVSSRDAIKHCQTIEEASDLLKQIAADHPECVHFGVTRGSFQVGAGE